MAKNIKAATGALLGEHGKKNTIKVRQTTDADDIREGIASGRYRAVAENEQIDITKHKNFVTVPKSALEPIEMMGRDGVSHPIPEGAYPRLLDHCVKSGDAPLLRSLHRAHHFRFGFEASEYLMLLSDEKLVAEMEQFAPHPFDEYTISMWVGSPQGTAELLIVVRTEDGRVGAEGLTLLWGEDWVGAPIPACTKALPNKMPGQELMWLMVDAFRLLMARPAGRTIIKGGPPRSALRKGKRVHFYSASEIKIDLDAAKKDRVVCGNGFGKMMPVYQYRAHVCHSGGLKHCEHEWIDIGGVMQNGVWVPDREHPRKNPNWECYHCGRRRWHRRAGTRGSAEVGYVRQSYNVVKGADE